MVALYFVVGVRALLVRAALLVGGLVGNNVCRASVDPLDRGRRPLIG